jgi:acyl carrier protein
MPEMNRSEMVAALTEYIVNEVASRPPEEPVTAEFPIIEGGLVDSLGLFKVISFIEERYPVRIPPEEILFENFATINDIVRLIEARAAAK